MLLPLAREVAAYHRSLCNFVIFSGMEVFMS